MKRVKTAFMAVLVFVVASTANAGGIPVIDVSNLAQAIEQVKHMVEQIEMLQSQLDKMQETLNSMTGSRGFGSGFPAGTYDTQLKVNPGDILNQYEIQNSGAWSLEDAPASIYDQDNENAASYLQRSQDSLNQAKSRFSDLQGLIGAIDSAPDQKAILDLQARIAGEQALLENERIKLAAIKAEAEARREMQEREAVQIRLNTIKRTPLDW